MEDLISRQAAIDALFGLYEYQRDIDPTEAADLVRQGIYLAEKKIEQLPSVKPERKQGKWIEARGSWYTPGGDPVWECSECGKGRHVYGTEHGSYGSDVADGQWVSCPNCGADMREDDHETD